MSAYNAYIPPRQIDRLIGVVATILLTSTIVIAAFGSYGRTIKLPGIVLPVTGMTEIKSEYPGTVQEIYRDVGAKIQSGQAILKLSKDVLDYDRNSTAGKESLTASELQLNYQKEINANNKSFASKELDAIAELRRLDKKKRSISRQMSTVSRRLTVERGRLGSFSALYTQKLIPVYSLQQQESLVANLNDQIESQTRELLSVDQDTARLQESLHSYRLDVNVRNNSLLREKTKNAEDASRVELARKSIVAAPVSGVLASISAKTGTYAEAGATLAVIYDPSSPLQVETLVPSESWGSLHLGDEVGIRLSTYPYEVYGEAFGRICAIPAVPETARASTGTDFEPVLRIKICPSSATQIAASSFRYAAVGMKTQVIIHEPRRQIYRWIMDPLNRIRESMNVGL